MQKTQMDADKNELTRENRIFGVSSIEFRGKRKGSG
jgi:hypothetical protein